MTASTMASQRGVRSATANFAQSLTQRWQALQAREQTLILLAAGLVMAALLWIGAIAPALAVLKTADAQHAKLDAQLQNMQAMQAQAKAMQSQPKINTMDASRALEASVKQKLGTAAQVSVVGSQATVNLKAVPAAALADWLTQARTSARAVPIQAALRRSSTEPSTWDGSLVLSLPSQ